MCFSTMLQSGGGVDKEPRRTNPRRAKGKEEKKMSDGDGEEIKTKPMIDFINKDQYSTSGL